MKKKIPSNLLRSKYRKEMWRNAKRVLSSIEKIIPVSAVYLRGSFATKKRRPADVDFIVLLKTKEKNPKACWSVDFVVAPDNKYGDEVVKDATKWMRQKYGKGGAVVIQLN